MNNQQKFLSKIDSYESFRKELEKRIKDNNISLCNYIGYYLINDSFINDGNIQYINKDTSKLKEKLEIINNISSAINCLKNKNKFIIFNKAIILSIFKNEELSKYKPINFYAGNNKIIIEYQEDNENKCLLLIEP